MIKLRFRTRFLLKGQHIASLNSLSFVKGPGISFGPVRRPLELAVALTPIPSVMEEPLLASAFL